MGLEQQKMKRKKNQEEMHKCQCISIYSNQIHGNVYTSYIVELNTFSIFLYLCVCYTCVGVRRPEESVRSPDFELQALWEQGTEPGSFEEQHLTTEPVPQPQAFLIEADHKKA